MNSWYLKIKTFFGFSKYTYFKSSNSVYVVESTSFGIRDVGLISQFYIYRGWECGQVSSLSLPEMEIVIVLNLNEDTFRIIPGK